MIDISEDPIVIKLIAHAKEHKTLTWDELTDLLPEKMTSSEAVMDEILDLLEQEQIQVVDDVAEETDDVFADELDQAHRQIHHRFLQQRHRPLVSVLVRANQESHPSQLRMRSFFQAINPSVRPMLRFYVLLHGQLTL